MKNVKKVKLLVIALVFIIFSMCFTNVVNAAGIKYQNVYVESNGKYVFNQREIITKYAGECTGDKSTYPYVYDVTEQMVKDKIAIPLTGFGFDDNNVNAMDTSNILSLRHTYKNNDSDVLVKILSDLENILGHKKENIELRSTIYKVTDDNATNVFSTKTSERKDFDNVIASFKDEFRKELIDTYKNYTSDQINQIAENEDIIEDEFMARRLVRLDAIMPDGSEYTLVLAGKNYDSYNWYMVRTKDAPVEEPPVEEPPVEQPPVEEPKKEFKTDLSYTAIVDGKVVDGTLKDGTYYPDYDRTKVEKDANVTAKITSTTKTDIVKINGVELNPDGTKNSLGWYYADKSDKTVIVKDYPFDTYDNLDDNGIKVEKDLVLTSIDDLTDKEDVSIEWPFRIIDLTQTPEKIDDKTEKVTFIITTNLPMEEEKLPDGWKFTDDEEGKTQHRIYKEFYKKDGNKKEDVIVIANNRDDKDNTTVKVEWPVKVEVPKEELPEVFPQTGNNTTIILSAITTTLIAGVAIYRKLRK